jgi:hypothetical protein
MNRMFLFFLVYLIRPSSATGENILRCLEPSGLVGDLVGAKDGMIESGARNAYTSEVHCAETLIRAFHDAVVDHKNRTSMPRRNVWKLPSVAMYQSSPHFGGLQENLREPVN